MKVNDIVILVGGRGSRISKLTTKTPKPLIKIGSKSFLDQLISKLIKYNFKKIYLLCSYKSEIFFKKFHKKKIHNSQIICINEGQQKDTGGALYKLRNIINSILVYCKKKYQKKLFENLKKLPIIKFKFINSGSEIIFKN